VGRGGLEVWGRAEDVFAFAEVVEDALDDLRLGDEARLGGEGNHALVKALERLSGIEVGKIA
jgi:hypothetical protein